MDPRGTWFNAANECEGEDLLKALQKVADDKVVEHGDAIFTPRPYHKIDLSEFLERPRRKTRTETFVTPQGFIEYVKSQVEPGTRIYGNLSSGVLSAVMDDYTDQPSWRQHVALFKPIHSTEWGVWSKARGGLSQTEFLELIEDMSHTFIEPSSADMMTLATSLRATTEYVFDSKVNHTTGGMRLTISDDPQFTTRENLALPAILHVMLPVYKGSNPVDLGVRLRVRIKDRKAEFTLKPDRAERLAEDQLSAMWALIGDAVGLPILI